MATMNKPATAPREKEAPVITPTKPDTTPAPKTPFAPSIEPDTVPKG